ncbi:MAG: flagellin [Selenomonadaceae bacterium]|nr:flagellin [Selenomonadaceae bacterium]
MVDQIDDNANVTYNGMYMIDGSHNRKVTGIDSLGDANNVGTYTHLTNRSFAKTLSDGNPVNDYTDLTKLEDSTGRNLGIKDGDTITVSWVNQGKTYVYSYNIPDDVMNLNDIFDNGNTRGFLVLGGTQEIIGKDASGDDVYTPDYQPAITYRATQPGIAGQISGLTICVSDKNGNINKSANSVLDNFEESIRAENNCPDNSIVLQIGTKANQAIKVGLSDMRSYALGLKATDGTTLNISTQKFSNVAINVLENALQKCLNQQTSIGSVESRLEYTSANIVTGSENTQASMSTMHDADMAAEMTEYTKNKVLLQAAQSMLAQANQNSSSVLSLLQ